MEGSRNISLGLANGLTNYFSFIIEYSENKIFFKKFFCFSCASCLKCQWLKCLNIDKRGKAFPVLIRRKKKCPSHHI